MTYDTQGRRILHSHPSTWEAECEQLRAQNGELALQVLASDGQAAEAHTAQLKAQEETRWQMIRAQQAIDEAKALRERVAQLEAALERFVAHYPNGINPMLDDAEIEASTALGGVMTKTTRIIRASIPGESSSAVGYLALVTMPAPPWEEPVTKEEAIQKARELGGSIRTHHNSKVST